MFRFVSYKTIRAYSNELFYNSLRNYLKQLRNGKAKWCPYYRVSRSFLTSGANFSDNESNDNGLRLV